MHSKIFQIGTEPISNDEYVSSSDFYENCEPWADYIGDSVSDADERHQYIKWLAESMDGVVTLNADNSLTYEGEEKLREYKQKWLDSLKEQANNLTVDNLLEGTNLYSLVKTTERTQSDRCSRFYIDDWNGCAGPTRDLFEFIERRLKKGDRIYIGAIIDFHW